MSTYVKNHYQWHANFNTIFLVYIDLQADLQSSAKKPLETVEVVECSSCPSNHYVLTVCCLTYHHLCG